MDLKEDIQSITQLKIRPAQILEKLNRNHRPVVITQNGQACAVVQDIASYERTRKALLLLKLAAQGESDFKEGRLITHKKLMNRLEKRFHG